MIVLAWHAMDGAILYKGFVSDVLFGAVLARVRPTRTRRDLARALRAHCTGTAVAVVGAVVAIQFGPTLAALRRKARPVSVTSFAVWHGMIH